MRKFVKVNQKNVPGILAFLLPAAVMFLIFVIRGIYPFGDRSFLFSDMYHQYMPFFSELLHKVRGGESLNFSFNVGIGSNFLALFVYYLASPFHVLSLLVPEQFLIEFMSYLIIVKVGLAGLTAYAYLRRRCTGSQGALPAQERDGEWGALLFSCFYALSGFMAAYNYNIMWVDCVVLLPLIVLGLERLVKEGRWGLYCVTLALSIYTNFYLSIMICIFLVLYFFMLLCLEGNRLRSLGYFALFSLLAGGMAALLLIPEVCAILETDFGGMDFPKEIKSYFPVFDMLARHCVCVYTERGLAHWPNIYCGSAVFVLVPMYLMNGRIRLREKFLRMGLAGFMLLGFGTNILDFLWHGLNYPDSLPGRQSFLYIFLVLTMCADAWSHVREGEGREIQRGCICAAVAMLLFEKFIDHEDFEMGVMALTLLLCGLYAVLLYLYCTRKGKGARRGLLVVALTVVVAECAVNTYATSVGTVSRSAYLEHQEDYRQLYQMAGEREEGFFRMEKFTRKTKNDGTLTGYPTASVFSSTLNSYVMDMYKLLGMRHSKVYYGFDGATALVSAMLNVKYMFGESTRYESSLYSLEERSGDICLYQCNAALPFGYVAPVGFDLPEGDAYTGISRQNRMVEDLGIQGTLFVKEDRKQAGDNIKFSSGQDGIYYAILTAGGTNKIKYTGGRAGEENFNDLKKGSILYLGYLREGDTITLSNGDEKDETPRVTADVYRMDEDVLREVLDLLGAQHMENVVWESDFISGSLQLSQAGRLILSVPGEAGWTVLVNGRETEPSLFGGCLMAFDLEPGEYVFEMKYVPAGAGEGILVSGVSGGIFVLLLAARRLRRRPAAWDRATAQSGH